MREEARSRPYSAAPVSSTRHPPEAEEPVTGRRALPRTEIAPEPSRGKLQGGRTPPPIVNDRTIALDRFVQRSDIDPRYLDTPYYIAPRDEVGQEAFAVIRDAIRDKAWSGWDAWCWPAGRGRSLFRQWALA
jgi:hypothetical protein